MISHIVLLSLCCGLANSARGSGIKNMKWPVLLSMALSAYTIWPNYWYIGLCPVPLLLFWIKPGGTGASMPWILSWFHILYIPADHQWRAFETFSVWIYMLIYLGAGYAYTI